MHSSTILSEISLRGSTEFIQRGKIQGSNSLAYIRAHFNFPSKSTPASLYFSSYRVLSPLLIQLLFFSIMLEEQKSKRASASAPSIRPVEGLGSPPDIDAPLKMDQFTKDALEDPESTLKDDLAKLEAANSNRASQSIDNPKTAPAKPTRPPKPLLSRIRWFNLGVIVIMPT